MDIKIIDEAFKKSLTGEIAFPQVVASLIEAKAERYTVDLVGFKKATYGIAGEYHMTEFSLSDRVIVPPVFDGAMVKQTVVDIQQGKIDYLTFLRRIMEAGCSHYEVYITGRKAIYLGRDGGQHIENFPSAK